MSAHGKSKAKGSDEEQILQSTFLNISSMLLVKNFIFNLQQINSSPDKVSKSNMSARMEVLKSDLCRQNKRLVINLDKSFHTKDAVGLQSALVTTVW